MKKITFLLDKNNNWIEKFVLDFIANHQKEKYILNSTYSQDDCTDNEVVFILGYTKILNKEFLNKNNLTLVIHESALPYGKGYSPVQWQILQNKKNILFSLFEAEEELDSGDILLQRNVSFSGYELLDEIRDMQGKVTIEMIGQFLDTYPNYSRKKQTGKETFFKKRTSDDDQLDVNKTILEQFNHFRIADNRNYPLWFELNGYKFELKINVRE